MKFIMDLYFCTQNLVTTQKYFAVPILTEVARSASCSGVKGVIPARVDRVRPGLNISSIFSDVFRHLPSCQALPRAPLSGHRGSELWDGKELYLRSLCLSVTLLKEIFNGQSHSSGWGNKTFCLVILLTITKFGRGRNLLCPFFLDLKLSIYLSFVGLFPLWVCTHKLAILVF